MPDAPGTGTLRPATEADLSAVVRLQDAAQAGVDVAVPHSAPRWRWLLARDGTTVWVVERDGEVVSTGRATDPDEGVLLAEAAAVDRDAAADLVAGLAATAGDDPLQVQRRPGPVDEVCASLYGDPSPLAEQFYVRLPDPAAVLDALRPVLWERHVASGLDRVGPRPGDLDLRGALPDAAAGERFRPGAGGRRDAGARRREGPRVRARLPGRPCCSARSACPASSGSGRTSTPAATPSGSRPCSRPCRPTC